MKKRVLFYFVALLFVWSCGGGDNPITPPSTHDNSLHDFVITSSLNSGSGLATNALVSRNGRYIYVTVDEGADVTALIPTIKSGEGTTFYMDGKPVDSGVTSVDFTNTVELTLVAEDGGSNYFYICLKTGNKQIDGKVYAIMKQYDIPGISVSATKDEKIVYSYGYGFANTATMERVTPKHLFRLASITKTQTAIGIMTLIERGQLKLNDRIFGAGGIFEKEFGTEGLVAGAENVTVKHFLEHNSGWGGEHIFTSSSGLGGKNVLERMNYVVHNIDMDYTPGAKYDYYNMGFAMLGCIIEKISGKDYETFMREEIYPATGAKDIWVGGDIGDRRSNECVYYSQDGKDGYGNDMELIRALGGLIASSEDLMRVMSCIDYGTVVPDILKPSTLNLMYTPSDCYARYALGWRTNHSIYTSWENYHGGTLAGTGTLMARDKDRNTASVVLCNSRSYKDGFDDNLYVLLDLVMKNI